MSDHAESHAGYAVERASRQDLVWSPNIQQWSSDITCCSNEDNIRKQIIEIWTSIGEAHNQRNFDRQSYPWNTVFANDFSCDISHTDKRRFTLEEYLASRSHLYTENESLRADLLSLVTHVDVACGTADVFSEQRVSGWEGNLTKVSMVAGTMREAKAGGRWLVCGWKIMQGIWSEPIADLPHATMMKGGCLCGRIEYEIDLDAFPDITACHCLTCQRVSGAPFLCFIDVPKSALSWTRPSEIFQSSQIAARGFCNVCGSTLTMEFKAQPETTSLTVGSITSVLPEALRIHTHIFLEDKSSYVHLADDDSDKHQRLPDAWQRQSDKMLEESWSEESSSRR